MKLVLSKPRGLLHSATVLGIGSVIILQMALQHAEAQNRELFECNNVAKRHEVHGSVSKVIDGIWFFGRGESIDERSAKHACVLDLSVKLKEGDAAWAEVQNFIAKADGEAYTKCVAEGAAGVISRMSGYERTKIKLMNGGPLPFAACKPPGLPGVTTGVHGCPGGIPTVTYPLSPPVPMYADCEGIPDLNTCARRRILYRSEGGPGASFSVTRHSKGYSVFCSMKTPAKVTVSRSSDFCYIATPACTAGR